MRSSYSNFEACRIFLFVICLLYCSWPRCQPFWNVSIWVILWRIAALIYRGVNKVFCRDEIGRWYSSPDAADNCLISTRLKMLILSSCASSRFMRTSKVVGKCPGRFGDWHIMMISFNNRMVVLPSLSVLLRIKSGRCRRSCFGSNVYGIQKNFQQIAGCYLSIAARRFHVGWPNLQWKLLHRLS